VLVVAPSASDAAMAAAADAGWSVLTLNAEESAGPRGLIRLPGRDVVIGNDPSRPARADRGRPGRPPWGKFALVRHMLTAGPITQVDLAHAAGTSQPQVSRAFADLRARGLVEQVATSAGPRWRIADRRALVTWWLDTYPGPGGITTYWFGLTPPVEQARAVVRHLQPTGQVAVSGDVAADLVAPWRRPQRAVVYAAAGDARAPRDVTAAGLTPSGAQEATLELVVPGDLGMFPPSAWPDASMPLADALQVAWDVRRAPGPDADQALDLLLTRLIAEDHPPGTASWPDLSR